MSGESVTRAGAERPCAAVVLPRDDANAKDDPARSSHMKDLMLGLPRADQGCSASPRTLHKVPEAIVPTAAASPAPCELRAAHPQGEFAENVSKGAASPRAQVDQAAAEAGSPVCGPTSFSAASLAARLVEMLFGDGERPKASGEAPAAEKVTNNLIITAKEAVGSLWAARREEIRLSCAPAQIDKEELLGYLLADALGKPLLHSTDARTVGKRAGSQAKAAATKLQEAVRGAKAAARVAERKGAPADSAARIAHASASVLDAAYDLNIPARTVGTKQQLPTPPSPPKGWLTLADEAEAAARAAAKEAAEAKARELLDADVTFMKTRLAYVMAEKAVLDCLNAPPSDAWREDWVYAMDAAERAYLLWKAARSEKVEPLRAAMKAADAAKDASWAKVGTDAEHTDAHTRRLCREADEAGLAYLGMSEATRAEAAVELMRQQAACRVRVWEAYDRWSDAERERRKRKQCGCVCEAHCCFGSAEQDCRLCLVGRKRPRGGFCMGYRSE